MLLDLMLLAVVVVSTASAEEEEKGKIVNDVTLGCDETTCSRPLKLEGVESRGSINVANLAVKISEEPSGGWDYTLSLMCESEEDNVNETLAICQGSTTNPRLNGCIDNGGYPWTCHIEATGWYLVLTGSPSPTTTTTTPHLGIEGTITTCDSLVCASSSSSSTEWVPVVIGLSLAAALALICVGLIKWRNYTNVIRHGEQAPIMNPKVYTA